MQLDFHYYATYCAAILAGYSHDESLQICTAAQYVDCCTRTALRKMKAPRSAATTQSQMEMAELRPGILTFQEITRIWASFHFLPGDLHAKKPHCSRQYLNKYRLICQPNGELMIETLRQAKVLGTSQAFGIAMHILADSWAHRYFAGTPSLVINSVSSYFYELRTENGETVSKKVEFRHKMGGSDDLDAGKYTSTLPQPSEWAIMNLGHGRVGHLPDYSFIRYEYLPAWAEYESVVKDNPKEYLNAFAQMIYALRWLRGADEALLMDTYAWDAVEPLRGELDAILRRRQLIASDDWKALGERLSGQRIPDFSELDYEREYLAAPEAEKAHTAPGQFIYAALAHKSMVTKKIFDSGSLLAGLSVDYFKSGFKGHRDFRMLVERMKGRREQ